MADTWSPTLLIAAAQDVRAAELRRSNGELLVWAPVAAVMERLTSVAADANTWRNRHDREKKRGHPADQRDVAYRECLQTVLTHFRATGEAPARDNSADAAEADPLEEEPIVHPANGLPVDQKGDIIFADRRQQPTDFDVEKLWTAYLEVMQAARPFKRAQKIARAEIQGNLPVGVAHFGDQHMGSWSLEAQRMLEDYKLLAQTEGLYANFLGDEADNFIFNFAKWASVMTPNHQRVITEWLMKSVKEKAIAWILGNHLHWSSSAADFDWVAKLAWLEQAFYLGHRGDLHLTVGQETYHFHLAHRAQGGSALNKSNSGRRTADTIGGADIIVEAHLHDPWLHQEYKGNKRQTWMRTGTYKRTDDYADSAGFPQAQWDMPMVILLPDTHRIIPFLDFRDGLETLAALRAQYKARAAALTA